MAGRTGGPKTRCNNQWTEARFTSFIKSNLRSASRKWAPIQIVAKEARQERGMYKCAHCGEVKPKTQILDGKRVNNCNVDHIDPIIDPAVGFTTWDDCIERMFVEVDGLQVLCYLCHEDKTNKEKAIAKERRTADE